MLSLKLVHVTLALSSGALFASRGLASLMRAEWPHRRRVKYLSYAIDTALLGSALTLVALLPHALFGNGWLEAKLGLLVVYIALGVGALRRAGTLRVQAWCFVSSLLAYAWIVSIAYTHHPLGWLLFVVG